MNTLDRLATQLRDDLHASAGPPPAVESLHVRSTRRTASRVVAGTAVVAAALFVAPQILPTGSGLSIDPVGPSADPGPSPSNAGTAQPEGPSEAPPPTTSTDEPDVRPIDVPSSVPIRVLAVRPSGPAGLAIIDLERGEVTTELSSVHDLPGDAIGGASLLTDGTVVVWQNGTIRTLTSGTSNRPALEHSPEELINRAGAAPSVRVVPSLDETALWLVQIGAGCCPEPVPSQAELVDLETGAVLLTAELPPASFPIATTPHGLVLNMLQYVDTGDGWTAEPGSHETFLLDHNGTVTDLAPGETIAASGNDAAVLTCDDHDRRLGCELDLVDATTGTTRRVNPPEGGTWTSATAPQIPTDTAPWKATAPDGRILAGLATPTRSHLVSIDPTAATAAVLLQFEGSLPPAAWDRDGERIVVAVGSDLIVHNPKDDESFTVRDAIPADHYILGFG